MAFRILDWMAMARMSIRSGSHEFSTHMPLFLRDHEVIFVSLQSGWFPNSGVPKPSIGMHVTLSPGIRSLPSQNS